MSEQTGPLGDSKWTIYSLQDRIDVAVEEADGESPTICAWVKRPDAQHLRDFARALDRAADQLVPEDDVPVPTPPRVCRWCGRIYAEHSAEAGPVVPRMPCGGLRAFLEREP